MYARILVEMNVYGEFPDEIYFINELDELVTQKVVYDWKPIICRKCKEFGHLEGKCKAGEQWKKTNKPTPKTPTDGVGTKESGAVRTMVTDHTKVVESKTPSPHGQTPIHHTCAKPPTPMPSTRGATTKIFLTNAAGEIVITTVEVNKDPRLRGDSSPSKG
ncbi:unnamed protein product [Amaranthus hypochondriacus]